MRTNLYDIIYGLFCTSVGTIFVFETMLGVFGRIFWSIVLITGIYFFGTGTYKLISKKRRKTQ